MEESKMSMKKLLTTISAGFALGLGLIALPYSAVTASAATSPRLQLRQNSYVYSISGKRKGKIVLKRGTYLRALSKKAIKGKKYYRIGKGRYIRTNNAVIVPNETKDKGPVLFSVYLKPGITLYSRPNGESSRETLIGKQKVYEIYKDANGLEWYRLPYKNWAKATDTQKSKPKEDEEIPTSDNWDDPEDNTSIEVQKEKQNSIPTGTALNRNTIEETGRIFESLVNEWRMQQGIQTKVVYTTQKSDFNFDYEASRAIEVAQYYDKYHQSDKHAGSKTPGELLCLVSYGSPEKMAQQAFDQFINDDASANYAHRNHLKRTMLKHFGIGLAMTHSNGYYVNGVAFVVSTDC